MDIAFENNQPVQVRNFPFEEIDRAFFEENSEHQEAQELRRLLGDDRICTEVATAIRLLLEGLVPVTISKNTPQCIGVRVLTLLWMLGSSKAFIGEVSLKHIADRIGCTRALLSHYAVQFAEEYGIHSRGQKKSATGEIYSVAALRAWKAIPIAARRANADKLEVVAEVPVMD